MPLIIYALRDSERGSIRYIGLTNNLRRRQKKHNAKFIDVLEIVHGERDHARKIEYWWMCWAYRKNQPITNKIRLKDFHRLEPCTYCNLFCGHTLRDGCQINATNQ